MSAKKRSVSRSETKVKETSESTSEPLHGITSLIVNFPFLAALLAGALLWFAMPPFGLWPLALLAPLPWIGIIHRRQLPKKYLRKVWLAAWIYWGATLYFIPIPHPAMWGGWFLLSLYCSIYIPLFVGISRIATHRFKIPIYVSVPVVWTGIEFFRVNFLTGFGLALMGHSLYKIPILIQIADIFGAYTISFVMLTISILLFLTICKSTENRKRAALVIAQVSIVALVLLYGYRHSFETTALDSRTIDVTIIQGNIDTVFPSSAEEAEQIKFKKLEEYRELASRRTADQEPDLVVWPEGKFPIDEEFVMDPADFMGENRSRIEENQSNFAYYFKAMQRVDRYPLRIDSANDKTNPKAIPSIIGTLTIDVETGNKYNSALLVDSEGRVRGRYLKMHRVLIGEYIPFERQFPALSNLSPSGQGLSPGIEPAALNFDGFILCPNICFESCVPHLIRKQVNTLTEKGEEPHCLVNLSDDGWFYGASCLDFHLANTVMRSVENRKPTIVAANTGISAFIDSYGRLRQTGKRREIDYLQSEFSGGQSNSLYRVIGDWPPFIMSLFCGLALAVGMFGRRSSGKTEQEI